MPSFSDVIADYFYGVTGILRKRSRYRCEKRGESFEKYEATVRDEQRKIGKPEFEERIKHDLRKNSLLSMIRKDEIWRGNPLLVPFIFTKRKRSSFRKQLAGDKW